MAGYGAYGVITSSEVTRTPFLVEGASVAELAGTTPVAVTDGATQPDLLIHLEIVVGLVEPGGTGSGNGFRVYMTPQPSTKVLTDLQIRVVIIDPLNSAHVSAQVDAGQTDPYPDIEFYVLSYETTGSEPMPPLVMFQLAQLTKVTTKVSGPTDTRLDDETAIEACEPHGMFPLAMRGGTATGDTITFPGKVITTAGPYAENDTTIRGIDLSRVLPNPPPTASSPNSATWFDLTASVPAAVTGTQTHLKATIRTPHAGGPPSAPTAAVSSAAGTLLAASYDYAVSFVHPDGNETSLGPSSAPVTLTTEGAVDLTAIDSGPASPSDPTETVVARRIYRRGPAFGAGASPGGDQLLVGELPGPAAASPPNPLPTTFTDSGAPIDTGGGVTLDPGEYRYPSRLGVRYTADTALDLDGTLLMVSAGSGSVGIDAYSATIESAPTEALVVNDDRAALLPSLQPVAPPRTRLQWSANATVDHLTLSIPGFGTPFGAGITLGIDAVPLAFGVDWQLVSDLLTAVDVRGQLTADAIPDPAPAVGTGGPDPFGLVWLIIGPDRPAAAWPAGEATVGVDAKQLESSTYLAVAVRGLRWLLISKGDGSPPPDTDKLGGTVLLGPDPAQPPEGERTLRLSIVNAPVQIPGMTMTTVWGRAGALPDRLAAEYFPYPTGDPDLGQAIQATITGALERVVGQVTSGVLGTDPSTVLRAWGSLVRTGDPAATPAPQAQLYIDGQNVNLTLPEPWQVEAALTGVPIPIAGAPVASIDAQLRLPTAPTVSFPANQYQLGAGPDSLWGRAALTWAGHPVATRSNPQVRVRNQPPGSPSFEGVTARLLGVSDGSLTVMPSSRDPQTGHFIDPVSKLEPQLDLNGPRPNGSLRIEAVEIDPRFQATPRTPWKARIGSLPDQLQAEIHSDDCTGGFFYVKASTSDPIADGVVWGEPLAWRNAADLRTPPFAGVQNVSALIATLPVSAELVMLGSVPAMHADDPLYGGGETGPRVHAPSPFQPGGVILRLGGPLSASGIRIATFQGDDFVCLDQNDDQTGFRSQWQEILVPLVNVNFDGTPSSPDDTTIWLWLYTLASPSPSPPASDPCAHPAALPPPPNPCTHPASKGPDHGYAYRIGDHLLVDVAVRLYDLEDASTNPSGSWNGFIPGTDVDGTAVGTWMFQDDLQMKGYRGEITLTTASSDGKHLPFGDWQAGPGDWYARIRDGLQKLIWPNLYVGDAFFGNTGGGFHIPDTNGVFNARNAIFNITWPS